MRKGEEHHCNGRVKFHRPVNEFYFIHSSRAEFQNQRPKGIPQMQAAGVGWAKGGRKLKRVSFIMQRLAKTQLRRADIILLQRTFTVGLNSVRLKSCTSGVRFKYTHNKKKKQWMVPNLGTDLVISDNCIIILYFLDIRKLCVLKIMEKRYKNDRNVSRCTTCTTTKSSMNAAMKLIKLFHLTVKTFPRFLIKCSI